MSSKKSAPPLHLEPRISLQLSMLLLIVHGLALIAIMALTLPVWVYLALVTLVILNFYITFNHHVLGRSRKAVLSMVWGGEGEWSLMTADGEVHEAKLLPGSYVHPLLVILNFILNGGSRRTVVLLKDSLDQNTHRKLLSRMQLEGNRNQDK